MKSRSASFRQTLIAAAVALLALVPKAAFAGDYEDASFTLRFPAALSRFATYADVAAVGNASAASKWATSINPASIAWLPLKTPWHLSITPQFSAIPFDDGPTLYVAAESLTWQTRDWGAIQPTAAQVRSDSDDTRLGPEMSFDADIFQLQWAVKPNDRWAFGVNVNYTDSELTFEQDGIDVADTDSTGWGVRLGALYQVTPKLRAGLVGEYAFSDNETDAIAVTPVGPVSVEVDDTTHQVLVRPGLAWEYATDSAVFFDYQFGWFEDDTGNLDVHRFHLGIDHQLAKGFFTRAGVLVDVEGKVAWAAGLGIYPSDWFTIDIGYQFDMFPEIGDELGDSQTFVISLSLGL